MEFVVRLVLPGDWRKGRAVKAPTWDHTTDMVDDDPDRPLFLAKAADVFAANGVRFEIQGFFEQPLPVSTDVGLVYFLEGLPGLLKFLTATAPASYTVGLWEQGIEAEFSFSTREHGDMVDVACSCAARRKMSHDGNNSAAAYCCVKSPNSWRTTSKRQSVTFLSFLMRDGTETSLAQQLWPSREVNEYSGLACDWE